MNHIPHTNKQTKKLLEGITKSDFKSFYFNPDVSHPVKSNQLKPVNTTPVHRLFNSVSLTLN